MNKVAKLNLMSKTEIKISENQYSYLIDKIQKISYLESKLENANLKVSPTVLTFALLEREGLDSSLIEGSQTNHEEMYFDVVDGIRDKYSWEVRNLINLYKSSFKDFRDEIIDFNIEDLKFLHRNLYKRDIENYETFFDPKEIIKKIKPGKIITNDSKPNWIGPNNRKIEEATFIPIIPSKKEQYLKDMFREIRKNKNQNNLKTLIKFHPFFEAVHPFADGNGRIGRLLLINLFTYLGLSKHNWIFISDVWFKEKNDYINQLRKVQTTNDWNEWTYYFVGSLSKTVDQIYKKIDKILEIYKEKSQIKMSNTEKKVLKYFFKYPILNRKKTVENLKQKYEIPNTTAYRSFDKVAQILNIQIEEVCHFKKLIKIIY